MNKKTVLALAVAVMLGGSVAQAKRPAKAATTQKTVVKANEPKITVKEAEDSLSRQLARIYGASINKMFEQRKGAASKDKFKEGFAIVMKNDTTNTDFLDGLAFGLEVLRTQMQMKSKQKINLNTTEFARELGNTLADTKVMSEAELKGLNEKVTQLMNATEQLARENDPQAIANKKAGAEFAQKTLKADKAYRRTASGLVYKVLVPGKGENFKATDVVKIKYKGTHIDGSTFDENGEGSEMGISNFVPGFKEALMLMNPGCKLRAIIPAELAYGLRGGGQGVIGPNETLVFDIETPEPAKKPEEAKKETPKAEKAAK